MKIPFNKPFLTGNELKHIEIVLNSDKLSGNGNYTKKCQDFFVNNYGFKKCLLTSSCTDALEMAAILLNIQPGDEVIMPSYTFVSTANAFVLRGATIIFIDSREDHPGMDEDKIESVITKKTKAIVPVHYAGVLCDMEKIMNIARKYNLFVVEDAAQAIESYYVDKHQTKRFAGTFGHLAAFSFHETKNIISGEGGMLVVNDPALFDRADIIWEKGTNRTAFCKGEVDKYSWVDIGSSFLPSEITAAFLFAQLEKISEIQNKRIRIWDKYFLKLNELADKGLVRLPTIPDYSVHNAHLFYIILKDINVRDAFITYLKDRGIHAVFHYLSLHSSTFYKNHYHGGNLPFCDFYSDSLVRLPLWAGLTEEEQDFIIDTIKSFDF